MKRGFLSRLCRLIKARSTHEGWRSYSRLGQGPLVRAKFGKGENWHQDFCADPFLFRYQGVNYLFCETVDLHGKGMICCFKEVDGKWGHLGKALEEPYHLSYPQVFEQGGGVYMIPESSDLGRGAVWLYEAEEFPLKWRKVKKLIDYPFADSTLINENGHWYMACYTIPPKETAELWHAGKLEGPWERHPQWDKINQSPRLRRCGGRFVRRGAQLLRIAQDCNGMYGKRLFAVPVTKLTPTEYQEGQAFVWHDRSKPPYRWTHTYNEMDVDGELMTVVDAHGYIKPFPDLIWSHIQYFTAELWSKVVRR